MMIASVKTLSQLIRKCKDTKLNVLNLKKVQKKIQMFMKEAIKMSEYRRNTVQTELKKSEHEEEAIILQKELEDETKAESLAVVKQRGLLSKLEQEIEQHIKGLEDINQSIDERLKSDQDHLDKERNQLKAEQKRYEDIRKNHSIQRQKELEQFRSMVDRTDMDDLRQGLQNTTELSKQSRLDKQNQVPSMQRSANPSTNRIMVIVYNKRAELRLSRR